MEDKEFDKHLKKAITTEERKIQKAFLRSIETSLKTSKKRFNWQIAASIVILIGFSGYFLLFNQSLSNEELYSKYFSPYENVVEPIVRDQIKLSKKAQIFSLYEQGEYEKAIDGFNQLTPQDSINVATISFYKANSYLQLKQFEKAKALFSQTQNTQEWNQESIWYLALIAIKLNDTDAALIYLKKLQKRNVKNEATKELIKSIN